MTDFSAWIEKNKLLWTRVYDEVIAPDLQDEWNKRDEAHKKELKQREENQQILFNHIEDVAVTNAHLVADMEQLKQQLRKSSKFASPTNESRPITATGEEATVSAEEHHELAKKYGELSKKYQDLSQKIKYLERKNSAVMQKNKEMKESVRAWQEYADRQSGKQKPKIEAKAGEGRLRLSAIPQIEDIRPHIPSSPRSVATVRTPLSVAEAGRSSPAPIVPLAYSQANAGRASHAPPVPVSDSSGLGQIRSGSITPKPTAPSLVPDQEQLDSHDLPQAAILSSSQTTEDESTERIERRTHLATFDEDDVPQFISARALKRKRGEQTKPGVVHGSSDGTPLKPFQIKAEPGSSPPNIHSLVRNETIDLDLPASTELQTPRHLRRNQSAHSNLTGMFRPSRSGSAPFTQVIKREDTRSRHLDDPPNVHVSLDEHTATDFDIRALSEPSDPVEGVDNVLTHLDPNVITENPNSPPNKRLRRSAQRKQAAHGILSESGEEPPPVDENDARLPPSAVRAKLSRKLHRIKSPQTPATRNYQDSRPVSAKIKAEQNPTPPPSTSWVAQTLAKNRSRNGRLEVYSDDENSRSTDCPQWMMQAPDSRPNVRQPLASPPKKQGRLRDKPLLELKLQDFKPNPAYNQGYTYAFSETVRKRGDRMCLPGCTNPQCCGSTFRTLAEAQAPLPASQEEALLQDYLGEAYEDMKMTQMEPQERQELVLHARTKQLAKEVGKHRQAYERPPTPPGFWRVDFPTTQEQQDDRARAKEQEKKTIQERWLEAQRKGGKWIFRDE
ncbi:SAE2-domain-containing protein [Setomelanomma holmii]|uniref:SAE2-domain-containing protein n=1 Tax=Setomelanomma holmii TaxID=210430 RepID=A0A9P4HFW1_9PLEO|nr:SAE2-domain-containing protein [Setomelanomma holmii]